MRVARNMLLALAAVFVTAGCAGINSSGPPDQETPSQEASVAPTIGDIVCGQPFRGPAGGALTLTAGFPATASAADQMVTGTVEVTSRRAITGVVSPRAEAFLIRDGRVVTMPMPQDMSGVRWDLASGAVQRVPADAALVSCEPGGAPLPPGRYEVYARVVITPDDGPSIASVGGPWSLEVT